MLRRTASAVERIVMALFGHRSPSPSLSPSPSPSRSRWSRSLSPSPSPNPSPNQLWQSPNPTRLPRSQSLLWQRRSPSRSPSRPSPRQSRRGWLPPVGECHLVYAHPCRRLCLLLLALRRHRLDPRPGLRPNRRLLSQPPLLEPLRRSHARAGRFRRPPAVRQRPLRASRFRHPPAGAGVVRRRAPEEGVLVVPPDRRAVPKGRVQLRQAGLLRL